jgi:chromosome segregation ATPase
LEAKDAELETELKRVETDLAEATQQMGDIELKLVAWQEASTQRDDDLEIRVEGLEMGVGQLSQALRAETEGRQGEVDSLAQDVEEMQGLLAKQAEALAAADGQLMKDVTTLRQDLVRSLEAVQVDLVNISDKIAALDKRTAILQQGTAADSKDLADLKGYVNGLQGELVTLNDRLVVTEEKLAKMDEQVTTQSSSQLSASLMREKRLERQLQELQEEFDSYRKQADKDNKSLKGASNIATIAAVIALIVAVVVNN